jgi:hypothetical protein
MTFCTEWFVLSANSNWLSSTFFTPASDGS